MKYVALLSGGKDSCYNLLHCSRNGHELIAAASLGPQHGKEEIDSYMYQTVGQDAIQFVADALDVPLYRGVIAGAAIDQGSEYGSRNANLSGAVSGDETEDLYALLSLVKNKHPDIEGVSVGAILSNYQRVRVEHVCQRLGLVPLCYLWQRDQAQLLSEMIEAGLEAVLIKVAGIGLKPAHLGKTLAEVQPTLVKLNRLYGAHICGEGGEYETLTLYCPIFKRRINLTQVETIIHSDNDFATVAYLRIKDAKLEEVPDRREINPAIPPILDEEYEEIRDLVSRTLSKPAYRPVHDVDERVSIPILYKMSHRPSSKRIGPWVAVANVSGVGGEDQSDISLEDELQQCFHRLQEHLQAQSLDLSHCVNVNIFLSSMDGFASVNAIYRTFFGSSPPARACVAVDLPSPFRVTLDCVAYAESTSAERTALHVQGLSYWAPANIGPYSQAIVADNRIFMSGQIGLLPSNLSIPSPQSLALETALSFQHVERISGALKNNSGGWDGYTQGVIYWFVNHGDLPSIKEACRSYQRESTASTLFLAVPSLPKGALVEKQVLMHTGRCLVTEDDDIVTRSIAPEFAKGDIETPGGQVHWEISGFGETSSSCVIICFRGDCEEILSDLQSVSQLVQIRERTLSVRVFYRRLDVANFSTVRSTLFGAESTPFTLIPCRLVSTREHDDWDYVMYAIGV